MIRDVRTVGWQETGPGRITIVRSENSSFAIRVEKFCEVITRFEDIRTLTG